MPETSSNRRPPVPAGEHKVTLKEVAVLDVPAYKKPGTVKKWAWRFETDCLDPKYGLPYEHTIWTQHQYGGAKANLTKLLDMLIPTATKEQKQSLNTDVLLNRRFETVFVDTVNDSGQMVPRPMYFKPTKAPMDPADRPQGGVAGDDEDSEFSGPVHDDNDEDAMRSAAEISGLVKKETPF